MATLHADSGRCRAVAQLSIRPTRAVIELGALADVIHAALNATHHANRRGDPDDRLAVALPGLHLHRGVARPGHEVVLFGSETALQAYLLLDGVQTGTAQHGRAAGSRGGMAGTGRFRHRVCAHEVGSTPWPQRTSPPSGPSRASCEAVSDQFEFRTPDIRILALHYRSAVIHVRELEGEVTDGPLLVSTYGFSSTSAPGVLPIRPDRTPRWAEDAA